MIENCDFCVFLYPKFFTLQFYLIFFKKKFAMSREVIISNFATVQIQMFSEWSEMVWQVSTLNAQRSFGNDAVGGKLLRHSGFACGHNNTLSRFVISIFYCRLSIVTISISIVDILFTDFNPNIQKNERSKYSKKLAVLHLQRENVRFWTKTSIVWIANVWLGIVWDLNSIHNSMELDLLWDFTIRSFVEWNSVHS